jgi:uncharacterized protein (DUF427 family)
MTNKPNYPIHTLASAPENSKPALEQLRQVFGVVPNIAGVIANSPKLINALTLREADYPLVQYIPREDVDLSQLNRTDHATYCPYKGDCNYYSVPSGGKKSVNAAWTYENPYPAVAQIKGHVAFYPNRVDEIAEQLSTKHESLKSS